jgi:hypothetical protein
LDYKRRHIFDNLEAQKLRTGNCKLRTALKLETFFRLS